MRFSMLGSGSKGNATLVESGNTCIMIDCGFSVKETEKRLSLLSRSGADIAAILVTHEHSDHISGVARFSRKYEVPVWATAGTLDSGRCDDPHEVHAITGHTGFMIGGLTVTPIPVPHDAAEPCQYLFADDSHRLGILTDTGEITPHIVDTLSGVDALILECNHDINMLENGRYPPSLKARVGSRLGHLNNYQSMDLLTRMDCSRLQHLVAAHISEDNNDPALVLELLSNSLGHRPDWLVAASQGQGCDWRILD